MIGSNGRRLEALERVETHLAAEQIKRTLDRLPDRELAEIAATQDTEALAAAGITADLIKTALGNPEDDAERSRRMAYLFEIPESRRTRIRKLMKEAK